MDEGYIGEIRMFAGDFAPLNWVLCNGQMLSINQYAALFSILGVRYGGDGRNTFAVPNLVGKVAMGAGTAHPLGAVSGAETANVTGKTVAVSATNVAVGTPDSSNVIGSVDGKISIMQPSVAMNYIICVNGLYPTRD